MKLDSKVLCIVAAAAALLSGCTKKPVRPDPSSTLGLGGSTPASSSLASTEIPTTADQNSTLEPRADGVIEDANTIRGLLQPVYFDYDRSSIKASERPKLQAAKDYLDKNPQYRILLEGHCDWRGTAEYNLGLGDRRAGAAKKYLVSLGVADSKVDTLSKGSEESAKNGDDGAMSKDRRVEIVVLKK